MQKTGQIERTIDREFADEEAKYKMCVCGHTYSHSKLIIVNICTDTADGEILPRYEKECQALQKQSKAYLDAMRGEMPTRASFSSPVLFVCNTHLLHSDDFRPESTSGFDRNVLQRRGQNSGRCNGGPRL